MDLVLCHDLCVLILILSQAATQLYFIEAVPGYSGSALGARTVVSCLGGALIPLCVWPTYDKLGFGWGNTVFSSLIVLLWLAALAMVLAKRVLGSRLDLILRLGEIDQLDVKRH